MNAYELAEGILSIEERIFLTRKEHKLFQNSANMLRQQADRIAELEKIVKDTIGQAFYEDDFHEAEAIIARQIQTVDSFAEENAKLCKRVAELEKQTELLQAKLNYMFEQELKSARINR